MKLKMSEREFQDRVIAEARLRRWLVAHFRPAMNLRGRYSTPMQGDPGFPDLVLVRAPRVVFAELKSGKGRLSNTQEVWLTTLGRCAGVERYVWWPDDADEISRILT